MPATITAATKEILRATLPHQMFAALRWCWWYTSFYLLRRIRSLVVTERPVTTGVGALGAEAWGR